MTVSILENYGKKIALSGCFSSGKTTMFEILSKRFPQLVRYPEIATATKLVCPAIDWREPDVRGYLRWAQITSELKCEQNGEVGLFDGSYSDLVAHERLFNAALPEVHPSCIPSHYAITLICDPTGVPIEINEIRETDENLRSELHRLVVDEAASRSRRVVELSGDIENRVSVASNEIHQFLNSSAY
jgi:nicotinamide riboside kinase